jgi:DNA replication protein DnaC
MGKDLELSQEDYNFLTSTKKMLEDKDIIGRNKYAELIQKQSDYNNHNMTYPDAEPKKLSAKEMLQIMQYEIEQNINKKQSEENTKKYSQQLHEPKSVETIEGIQINKTNLYHGFKQAFKTVSGKDFEENDDTLKNLEPVLKYFAQDETFFNCERLHTIIDGVELNPSFRKGLLIIGNYGNGKSTIMKTFELLFNHNAKIAVDKKWDNAKDWISLRFKIANCHDIVTEFEACKKPEEKENFYKKYSTFRYSFDDIKKEKLASNYGLTNVMQAIFEKRYDGKKLTFGTCNYPENEPNNLSKAIEEFGTKYGGHIYDRVFEQYNIIEFQGKSFRK